MLDKDLEGGSSRNSGLAFDSCHTVEPSLLDQPHSQSLSELSMKEGSLFCFVVMKSTELGCFRSCSWCLWNALSMRRGAWVWFHDIWICGAKVLEY
jgi:hypothetical protein